MAAATAWLIGLVIQAGLPSPTTRDIVVDPRDEVSTLTVALSIARDGDRIVVRPGQYHEPTILINKRVTIVGDSGAVFDGGGDHQVFTVTADSVTLRGLEIREVGASATDDRAGIKVIEAKGCVIEANVLIDTFFGIYLSKTSGCVVRRNRLRASGTTEALSGNAIHSWSSDHLLIEENDIAGHRDGIYFEFTTAAKVRHNRSRSNLRYGLHFMFSNDCEYSGNVFEGNGAGVAVMYSKDVSMQDNRFEQNWGPAAFGLLLKEISDSRIERNRFAGNSVGLSAEGTNRLTVAGNDFERNGWAVLVMADAVETTFLNNQFSGNAFDVGTNSVNSATRFSGNYWDRYRGYDLDRDGTGDVPFAPVRLFGLVVQQHPPALILLHSFFIRLLDMAERALPVLTPPATVDSSPRMAWTPEAAQ
ncbi:MAG TPA: nitrous oxide reductase family maturation protein NosD [Gemmatimonadales bacterium]|nr:nitrous oxide reductase family maturation protein NosD [Gemmatimonadales bacterium]